jgi:hypothetical protein
LLLAYVDDIVVAAETSREIDEVMKGLSLRWKITELGEISTILGMKVSSDRQARKVWLTQPAYIDKIVERFPGCRPKKTPLSIIKREQTGGEGGNTLSPIPLTPYQEIVGCLQWVAGCTRPDISFAASFLARQVARPTEHLWQMALGVVAYLSSTRTVGLTLGGKEKRPLEGWVDADWAGCQETRRSTTGWIIELKGSPIVWSSRRQATVSASTTEAEYIAITEARREIMWLRELLETLGHSQPITTLRCDNQGAIALTKKPSSHPRTKHIAIRHHQTREWAEQGMIRIEYVDTKSPKADILTKPLSGPAHAACVQGIGLARPKKEESDTVGLYMVEERPKAQQWNLRRRDNGWRPVARADLDLGSRGKHEVHGNPHHDQGEHRIEEKGRPRMRGQRRVKKGSENQDRSDGEEHGPPSHLEEHYRRRKPSRVTSPFATPLTVKSALRPRLPHPLSLFVPGDSSHPLFDGT